MKSKDKSEMSLNEIKDLLILMKSQGVTSFIHNGLSVTFSEEVINREILQREERENPETEEDKEIKEAAERALRIREEEKDLYGSSEF